MTVQFLGDISGSPVLMNLDSLAADTGFFRMSIGFDIEPLAMSIREVGLLNPPFVLLEDAGVHVVAGYRRVLALRKLGCRRAPCMILPADFPRKSCILLNFNDNIVARTFNPMEKAMALSRLSNFFPPEHLISRFMPVLGLSRRREILDLHISMDRELDGDTKLSVASGRISVKAAAGLLKLEPDSRRIIYGIFSKLNFNSNQQMQILDLIQDISHRDKISPSEVLQRPVLGRIVSDPNMNTPQKARAFLDHCRRMRNPYLHSALEQFTSRVKSLNLPDGVDVLDPGNFEAPHFKIEMRFRDGVQLKRLLDETRRLPLETVHAPWNGGPYEGS